MTARPLPLAATVAATAALLAGCVAGGGTAGGASTDATSAGPLPTGTATATPATATPGTATPATTTPAPTTPATTTPATHSTATPLARPVTTVSGWSGLPAQVDVGTTVRVRVRVRVGGQPAPKRAVTLQQRSAEAGTPAWTTAQRTRTGARGRATLTWAGTEEGTWDLRVRVPGTPDAGPATTATATVTVQPLPGTRVYAVADVGWCDGGTPQVADLVTDPTAPVLVAGDVAYPEGTEQNFADCYDPYFGRFRDRTLPVPGNHEYRTPGAAGYFDYFGSRVGSPGRTYYATDVGDWRILLLDSNCDEVGGCGPDSPQYAWLAAELAADPGRCVAAVWHHPRWSSGPHGDNAEVADLYDLLVDGGVDLLLSGHDHGYERFARTDAAGRASPTGVRQFVVGMGGAELYPFARTAPNSQARTDADYGLLQLDLGSDGYSWRFLPAGPSGFTDSGSDAC